jgi:hypothetical protein
VTLQRSLSLIPRTLKECSRAFKISLSCIHGRISGNACTLELDGSGLARGRGLVACAGGRAARRLPGIARREVPRGVPVQVGNRSAARWRDQRPVIFRMSSRPDHPLSGRADRLAACRHVSVSGSAGQAPSRPPERPVFGPP